MSKTLPLGCIREVPGLVGRWSVWSDAEDQPGAVFMVPANDEARASGIKYAVVKAIQEKAKPFPTLTVLRTDPSMKAITR